MLGIQLGLHRGLLCDLLFRNGRIFLVTCWSWDGSIICRVRRGMMLDTKLPQHRKEDSRPPPSASHQSPALSSVTPHGQGTEPVPVSARNCSCPSGFEGGAFCSCSCCFLCSICRTACSRWTHRQEVMASERRYAQLPGGHRPFSSHGLCSCHRAGFHTSQDSVLSFMAQVPHAEPSHSPPGPDIPHCPHVKWLL